MENQLHWVLDVPLNEDQSRSRSGHAAEKLGALRGLVLSLLGRDIRCQGGSRPKNSMPHWDHAYPQSLLGLNA